MKGKLSLPGGEKMKERKTGGREKKGKGEGRRKEERKEGRKDGIN